MIKAEEIVHVANQLPGYEGYVPVWEKGELKIQELWFQLYEDELDIHYRITLSMEPGLATQIGITARYSDHSIQYVEDGNGEHRAIWNHALKLTSLFRV